MLYNVFTSCLHSLNSRIVTVDITSSPLPNISCTLTDSYESKENYEEAVNILLTKWRGLLQSAAICLNRF